MPEGKLPFAGGDNKFFTLEKFQGLNTKAKRPAIGNEEFSWLENMQPIGDGNLRSLYSNGASIYTAAGGLTIIYAYFFNVGSTTYAAVFLSDGTADSVNTSSQVVTHISTNPGDFYPGSATLGNPAPACAQWGQSGIVIVSTGNVGYSAWDGATFYPPGSAAPNWLTNTTPTTMPNTVQGTAIETFANRAWVWFGAEFFNSAPGNGADFSGPDGGGVTPSNDSFLKREFTHGTQSNGFLYMFADSSVNVVSNVQTGSSPVTTTFNNQNVDPQTGTPWHSSVQAFGTKIVFANQTGVYSLEGGSAQKVSDALDGIFASNQTVIAGDSVVNQPSSAVMTINSIKTYMLLIPVADPFTGVFRLALAMWDGKKWFLGSQVSSLTFICTQEINSVLQAWGTDGTNLFPLFSTSSSSLRKIWQTRLWPGDGWQVNKKAMRLYTLAQDNSGTGYTFTGTLDYLLENKGLQTLTLTNITSQVFTIIWQNNSLQTIQFQNNSNQNINFTVNGGPSLTGFGDGTISATGALLGLTEQSTSPDFTLIAQSLLYQNQSPIGA